MLAYLAILKIRTGALLQYRTAAFAGMCTQLFWGFINVMVFKAFYTGDAEPLSLTQTLTFVWIGQALWSLLPLQFDKEIESQIRTGQVAYELVRPLHLYTVYFVKSLAIRLIPMLMRSFPIFFLAGLFLDLQAPVSATALLYFISSLVLATLLSAAMTACVSFSLFWTLSGEGIKRLLPHLAALLTGIMVPLPLFPSWAQTFLNWQPFRCIIDIPCRIYTGVIPESQTLYFLGFQLLWTLFFVALGQFLLHKATKRLVIQGG